MEEGRPKMIKQSVALFVLSVCALAGSATVAANLQLVHNMALDEAVTMLEIQVREESYRADDAKERGYRLIQQLQKSACGKDARLCQVSQRECIARVLSGYAARGETVDPLDIKWSCQRRSTRYEVPGLHNLLVESLDVLTRAGTALGWSLPEINVGTLGTAGINASAQTAGAQRDHVILVRHDFLEFSNQLAVISASALPLRVAKGGEEDISDDLSDIEDRLDEVPQLVDAFQSAINRYTGGKTVDVNLPPDSSFKTAAKAIIADGVRLFMLGHEIGHIVKDHTTSPSVQALGLSAEEAPRDVLITDASWAEELEADIVGLRLLRAAAGEVGGTTATSSLILYSPSYYFLLRQVLAAYDSSDDPVGFLRGEKDALAVLANCLDDVACDLVKFVKASSTLRGLNGHPSPRLRREVAEYVLNTGQKSTTSQVGRMMKDTVVRLWRRALRNAYR